MVEIVQDVVFDQVSFKDSRDHVYELCPQVHSDPRGSFTEVFNGVHTDDEDDDLKWLRTLDWVKQINRSTSIEKTIRGCHAQTGKHCQGKLVSALSDKIYDVITDARPDSNTFGASCVFVLDPKRQNMLWVPRGFLHAFAVPHSSSEAVFEYFVDESYDKASEICINPMSLLPKISEELQKLSMNDLKLATKYFDFVEMLNDRDSLVLSEKDLDGRDYLEFINETRDSYEKTRKLWYR